jgi:hypothetical protein
VRSWSQRSFLRLQPSPRSCWNTPLDVDRLASSHDAELDELLFGDSEPGLDTADEQLAQPMSPLAAHDLFVALAQLSHDTSPGLLEAPDTLPG